MYVQHKNPLPGSQKSINFQESENHTFTRNIPQILPRKKHSRNLKSLFLLTQISDITITKFLKLRTD